MNNLDFAADLSLLDPELQIILDASYEARRLVRGLSRRIVPCRKGPYESTALLDVAAQNLGENGPVQIVELSPVMNAVEVCLPGRLIRFPVAFAECTSEDRVYEMHAKGRETYARPPQQFELELDGDAGPAMSKVELHPFMLRVVTLNEDYEEDHELHFCLCELPIRCELLRSTVRAYERYVVKRRPRGPLTPAFDIPFDPEIR